MRRTFQSVSSRFQQSASPSSLRSLGTPASDPQPAPSGNGQPVVDAVLADVQSRRDFGLQKYGTLLRTHNGRDAAWDLYQELLDAVMYLRQFILERQESPAPHAVNEGKWSPVYDRDGILAGYVTLVEKAVYYRPLDGVTVSSKDAEVIPPSDAPNYEESYKHRATEKPLELNAVGS